jgi:Ca2+-transporting ATPase
VIAGVSLGIATVPEEVPIVYTLYLALGARRLAREHALVRRLPAVETLGSTTVICADKTGTLTLGRVEVADVVATGNGAAPTDARQLLVAAVLASEPEPFDPLDQAIVRYADAHGISARKLHAGDLVRDYAFDNEDRYLTHVWRQDGKLRAYAKGAVEGMLERSAASADARARAMAANRALAAAGMRVIAVAAGPLPALGKDRAADEQHLRFLGVVGFRDPPRPGVAAALRECAAAGIRVVMITGDHPVTAHAIAEGLDLPHRDEDLVTGEDVDAVDDAGLARLVGTCNIFARMRPEQKHRLVEALRAQGAVVAMTGDGINDAPALRDADIGVALGGRGTDVAREAATLVLADDNFSTIVTAVREGRRIRENLRRAFSYLVSFHIPLVLAALVVPLTGEALLLLPVHLILLQLVVHPTASLVFEADPAPDDVMRRPPAPRDQGLLPGALLARPVALGLVLTVAVLGLYFGKIAAGAPVAEARGTALVALLVGQTLLVVVERSPSMPVWRSRVRANPTLLAVLASMTLLVATMYSVPTLRELFRIGGLSLRDWLLAGSVGAVAVLWIEPFKASRNRAQSEGISACSAKRSADSHGGEST